MERRKVLRSLPVIGIGMLSGCSFIGGGSSNSPQLLGVGVINWEEDDQTIRIKMKDGETTIFEEQAELKPKAEGYEDTYYRQGDSTWKSISEYTYSIRISDGSWNQLDPSTNDINSETKCALLQIDLGVWEEDEIHSLFVPRPCDYEFSGTSG